MKTLRLLTDRDKSAFNKLATHPIQSWEWGEFRRENGNRVVRIGAFEKNKLTEGQQLTVHKLPHTKYFVAMLLKGPLPSIEMLEFLKIYARQQHILFIRLEPNVTDNLLTARKFLQQQGAVPGKRFFTPETFVLDLTQTEESLVSSFHPKTRYNIKLAQKRGVTVQEESSPEAFETYLSLTEKTAQRQSFLAHTATYHKRMWKHLHPAKIAHLLVARYEGQPLVAWIVFVWHNTLYYPYGASSDMHRNVMAPNLIMWEAIRFGKKLQLERFDLWGKEEGKGFTRFKEGYNPQVVEFVGTWDLVVNPTLYRIYKLAEAFRWTILKLPLPLPKPSFR